MKTEAPTNSAKQVVFGWIFLLCGVIGLCAMVFCMSFGYSGLWKNLGIGLASLAFFFFGGLLLVSYDGPDDPDPMQD